MNGYIYWNEKLQITTHLYNTIILKVIKDFHGKEPNFSDKQRTYSLNDTAAEIIQLINGTNTYYEVISLLAEKYSEDFEIVKKKVDFFISNITKEYGLTIKEQDSSNEVPVILVDKRSIYPTVVSIEVTNKCNIKCKHCYGDFGDRTPQIITIDQIIPLLDDLKEIGVQIVELTGGEITTHPNAKEIISYAVSLNFSQVSVLTNGLALTNEIIDLMIKNKSKIFVQIDLQSLKDEYVTWFTKIPNTLPIIQKNIKKLAENGVKMRIATTVTHKNIDEIEDIAEWIHNLGIEHFGITPVISLGRAINSESNLYLTPSDFQKFESSLNKINDKHTGFLSIIDGDRTKYNNCACLTSHFVISSSGDIKICTMDNLEYFNSSIGNVFQKGVREIYDDNAEYIAAFYNMLSPKIDSEECKECENRFFCNSCILRGLVKAKEMKEKCSWYKNQIPKIVKDKLQSEGIQIKH